MNWKKGVGGGGGGGGGREKQARGCWEWPLENRQPKFRD